MRRFDLLFERFPRPGPGSRSRENGVSRGRGINSAREGSEKGRVRRTDRTGESLNVPLSDPERFRCRRHRHGYASQVSRRRNSPLVRPQSTTSTGSVASCFNGTMVPALPIPPSTDCSSWH